jgi:uncharacterized protein (TIGR04551 family)
MHPARQRALPRRILVALSSLAALVTVARTSEAQQPTPAATTTTAGPTAPPPASPPSDRPALVPGLAPPTPEPGGSGSGSGPSASQGSGAQAPADAQKTELPSAAVGAKPGEVFAEDWWAHTRPVLEMHGYYRVRAEFFYNFALGRADANPTTALWQPPVDYHYVDATGQEHGVKLCGSATDLQNCNNKSQSSANMRFRLNPELHVSDNLRILSQIDMLDNLVLGSTPTGYYNTVGKSGLNVGAQNPYAPRAAFSTTQDVPTAGSNSYTNSVSVKRVWGEYMTPVGLLRFGRQPSHWGLGILANSGDGYDSDWQTTTDRIMFVTGIKSLDLYFAGAWDFPNEGATSANAYERGGQPYDLMQSDDVNQYSLTIVRRRNPELAKQDLADGKAVINGGLFVVYRSQELANDTAGDSSGDASLGQNYNALQHGLVRRGFKAVIPDLWGQIRYRKFRFEFEAVTTQGSIENTSASPGGSDYRGNAASPDGWKVRQYMIATQAELKALEDRLRVQFGFGWASGDPDVGDGPEGLAPKGLQLQPQQSYDRTFSMARFHPDYRVDLILFRNILTRVQGAYYFRPSVDYDFARNLNGQKFGGGAAVIWSRASEFVQAPGHKRDLGVELDFNLYYQSKDGSLNDDPDKMGGFFTQLQYGVLFPLGGLGYQTGEVDQARQAGVTLDTGTAHTLRWFMGIFF